MLDASLLAPALYLRIEDTRLLLKIDCVPHIVRLKKTCGISDVSLLKARFQQLRTSLANCRQLDSTIDDYFGRLTKILDAMQECNPSCSCTKCEWNLALAKEQEIDQIRVHEFGLDDGTIRQQLCAQAPTHP
ncbi:unnamed protein product [Microthlaspi erraticum]|uniref:Uncharacterized protein n=1 Tax=Microthlaspi erraticum TaxID=1685480 RepID=A0A6D2JHY3_9BRAS|nr:unnamed protein product [Microthlaspi erraticum]